MTFNEGKNMASKKYDIAVAVGEYTDKNGDKKKRYQNVGVVMQGDNGPYILLERWFNPAGIVNADNRSNLILSLFEPRDNQSGGQQSAPTASTQPASDDSDIPF